MKSFKLVAVVVTVALAGCGYAQAENYPCGIASLKLDATAVAVRFDEKAYWYYTKSQFQLISGSKVINTSEDGDNFPFVRADALYVPEGQKLNLWIPHISCQVRFNLTAEPPGIYVIERTSGVVGTSNTGEVFYPLAGR